MPDNRYQTWPEFSLENIKYTRHTLSSQTLAITYQAPTIRRLLPTSLPWPLPPPTLNSLHCIQSSKLASAVGPPSSWVPCLELFLEVVTGLVPSLCLGLSQNVTYAEGTHTVQSGLDYGSRLSVSSRRKHPHSCQCLFGTSRCRQGKNSSLWVSVT